MIYLYYKQVKELAEMKKEIHETKITLSLGSVDINLLLVWRI